MPFLFGLATLVVITWVTALYAVPRGRRGGVLRLVGLGWCGLLPLLVVVNQLWPFTPAGGAGGDDEPYFRLCQVTFSRFSDFFDVSQFAYAFGQPGYAWLLAVFYQIVGSDLLALKMVNLAAFLCLIPLWYRIGEDLESPALGTELAVLVLFSLPLWYYWAFLLKDVVITLLQCALLCGVVSVARQGWRLSTFVMIAVATIGLIPFRVQLVPLNAAILSGTIALGVLRSGGSMGTKVIAVTGAVATVALALAIAANPVWLAAFGIVHEDRVLGTAAYEQQVLGGEAKGSTQIGIFLILYILSETGGLSPSSWNVMTTSAVRGFLGLPWILVGVPFLFLGFAWILRPGEDGQGNGTIARVLRSRIVNTPWSALVLVFLMYGVVTWVSGDTTRWRIPGIPAMYAIAWQGWRMAEARKRRLLLVAWTLSLGIGASAFYLLRELA